MKTHKFLWRLGLFFVWIVIVNFGNYFLESNWVLYLNQPLWQIIFWLVVIGGTVIYLRMKAGLISAVLELLEKKETSFKLAFRQGSKFYFELFKLAVILALYLVVAVFILAFPVSHLFVNGLSVRAIILGTLGTLILLPILILVALLGNLAAIFIVAFGWKTKQAIEASYDLIRQHWIVLLSFAFILAIIVLPGYSLLYLIWENRIAFSRNLSYNLAGIGLFIVISFFNACVVAYGQVAWVLLFQELVKPQKFEEEEKTFPLPEVV